MFFLANLIADANIFGTVDPPPGIKQFNDKAGTNGIGILIFFSNMIKLLTIVAGLWVFFNFISAGYTYITAQGDSSAHTKVKDQITMSVLGLIIIVAAYTIIALLSFALFGNPAFILNPVITGPS
jgi:hypothetical protein